MSNQVLRISCNKIFFYFFVHSVENTNNKNSSDVGEFIQEAMEWNGDLEDCPEGTREENKESIPPTDQSNNNIPSILYNKLTMSFQLLAEDISKNFKLANLLDGFIIKAQKLLCQKKGFEIHTSVSTVFSTTTASMMNINQKSISNSKNELQIQTCKIPPTSNANTTNGTTLDLVLDFSDRMTWSKTLRNIEWSKHEGI